MPKLALEAFREKEKRDIEDNRFMKMSLTTLVGVPSVIALATEGAAIGGAMGAIAGGIGAVPGSVLGGIIGAAVGLIGGAIISYAILPKLSEWIVKGYRRLTKGDFNYRFIHHDSERQASEAFDRFIKIAGELNHLDELNLIKAHDEWRLYLNLNETEITLMQELRRTLASCESEKKALEYINSSNTVFSLKEQLKEDYFIRIRSEKLWAKDALATDPTDLEALRVLNGIEPGRGPGILVRLLRSLFGDKMIPLMQPVKPYQMNSRVVNNIRYYPHLAVHNGDDLVFALTKLDKDEINGFSNRVLKEVDERYRKVPRQLLVDIEDLRRQQMIDKMKLRSEDLHLIEEVSFVEKVYQEANDWFAKPHGGTEKYFHQMTPEELAGYRDRLALKLSHHRHDKSKEHLLQYRLARVNHLIRHKEDNVPPQQQSQVRSNIEPKKA